MTQALPPKENALFKSIVKHYETKCYKKGIKAAETVLKKFPDHGETLAMKGLILNCMDKKTEAYELVRRGVKQDIKSHVCWHVYGLLYRSDRDYLQAIKCYRGALRQDPENVQILRDLSLLQAQMRDLDGFVETRQTLLTLKPTQRINWFSFAVATQLSGKLAQAVGIVEAYEKTLEGAPENDYEHGEMLLYKNTLLEEDGRVPSALQHLEKSEPQLVDKLRYHEKRAQLLVQLGRFADAVPIYRDTLLKRNPEHYGYHGGLQAAALQRTRVVERWVSESLPEGGEEKLKALYAELQRERPRSTICKRLPLDFARDPTYFKEVATAYIVPLVRKGVPSLFADLKPLYADAAKAAALGELFAAWLAALEATGTLPGESAPELPSSIMWIRVLLAQHLDKAGDSSGALAQIDLAIAHTPTLLDLYMIKARVYKHAGALALASEWMDSARQMDLADRYLNTKATRYMLRNNQVDTAAKTIALFTKDGENGSNLFDMQCMWYELEVAGAHLRLGDYGRALKNYGSVEKHFNDIVEDQFDFHTYCIRKMTLRAYVRMLRLEDRLYGHAFFVKAASGIISTYLRIFDQPKLDAAAAAEAGADDELSAAERKKAESKRRKAEAQAKAAAEAAAKTAKEAPKDGGKGGKKGGGGGPAKPVDDDPDGAALARVEDPLAKAGTYLRTLQLHAPAELCTHTLAAELALRRGKFLLALRALRKAAALAGSSEPAVHRLVVEFLQQARSQELPPAVAQVVDLQSPDLGVAPGASLVAFNDAYLEASPAAAAQLAGATLLAKLAPERKADALRIVAALPLEGCPLPTAVEAHALLAKKLGDAVAADAFKARASARFPLAEAFL